MTSKARASPPTPSRSSSKTTRPPPPVLAPVAIATATTPPRKARAFLRCNRVLLTTWTFLALLAPPRVWWATSRKRATPKFVREAWAMLLRLRDTEEEGIIRTTTKEKSPAVVVGCAEVIPRAKPLRSHWREGWAVSSGSRRRRFLRRKIGYDGKRMKGDEWWELMLRQMAGCRPHTFIFFFLLLFGLFPFFFFFFFFFLDFSLTDEEVMFLFLFFFFLFLGNPEWAEQDGWWKQRGKEWDGIDMLDSWFVYDDDLWFGQRLDDYDGQDRYAVDQRWRTCFVSVSACWVRLCYFQE